MADVTVAVDCDFVAPLDQLGQAGRTADLVAQAEEGRPPAQGVEGVENGRRGRRVGPVVEGQGHVVGAADAGQSGQQVTPGPAPSDHAGKDVGQHRPTHQRSATSGRGQARGDDQLTFPAARPALAPGAGRHARVVNGRACSPARAKPADSRARVASSWAGVAPIPLTR